MTEDLRQIDAAWAWSPYVPDAARPWDRRRAAHLFRRAGFAANPAELDAAVASDPAEVVRNLVAGGEPPAYRREIDELARTILATGDPRRLAAVWVYRLLGTPAPLLEKMTLFWHGHFATGADKVQEASLMLAQNELLRREALGDFGRMVQEISRDPAMLLYLDSATNRKAHPNENYAREVMELFCLGEGNYTERDVRELARCFTGWEVRRGKFRFNRYQHDAGSKRVLGTSGELGGEEGVELVLQQPAAPRFIVGKLMRYFLFDEPAPPPHLVEPLAVEFRENGLQVAPIVERMLGSQLCFSPHAVGRKVRGPVELAVGLLRALRGTTDAVRLAEALTDVGQGLFYPPNVKGWEGGRAWINSSTLLGRANLVRELLDSEKTRFDGGDLETLARREGVGRSAALVDWLLELLVAVPVPRDARRRLVALAKEKGDRNARIADVIHALSTLPEFQLA